MGSPAHPVENISVALTIAGSDSGGGAGIQADLKVFFELGCHGTSAITALTAQNTVGVTGVHPVPEDFVIEQIEAVVSDIGVDAAKTGMLATAAIVEAVAGAVRAHNIPNLVVDPVAISKHGDRLMSNDALDAYRDALFPVATIITPNLHEAGALLGREVHTLADAKAAARDLARFGSTAVLVKGGHLEGPGANSSRSAPVGPESGAERTVSGEAVDVLVIGEELICLSGPRFDTEDTHGTGCALSAAIAARLAHGDGLEDAVSYAKDFVSGAIQHGLRIGKGFGPVNPRWRVQSS